MGSCIRDDCVYNTLYKLYKGLPMLIFVNGRREDVPAGTVGDYIRIRNLKADNLVVEYNQRIIRQSDWDSIHLGPNDALELVSFVGGG